MLINRLKSLLLLATGRPHLLGRLRPGGVLPLSHHLLLVHFLRVVYINIGPLLLGDHPLLLLVVIQRHTQVLQDAGGDLIGLEILCG